MVDDPIPTELRAKALVRKTGEEEFTENGVAIARLSEYWQWSASDLLGNTERGRLAEYIVATAVGVAGGVRSGWEPYDVETLLGTRVEVKASAYVQTWGQKPCRRSFSAYGQRGPGTPSKTCLPSNPVVRPMFTFSLYSPSGIRRS